MGQVPFSPDLMKYYFLQQLWLLVWQKKAGHHISSSKIRQLSKKCSLPDATLVDAEAAYRAASLHYRQLKPLAAELRSNFLHCRILEPQSSEAHTKAVANILHNKRRRESYQEVHRLKGAGQMSIEHQLGAAFSHHFQGANSTPFL